MISTHKLSHQKNPKASEPKNLWTGNFDILKNGQTIIVACNNSFIYFYDIAQEKEVQVLECFYGVSNISLSPNECFLVSSGFNEFIFWDLMTNTKIFFEKKDKKGLIRYNAKFHPQENIFVLTNENKIRFYNTDTSEWIFEMVFDNCDEIAFSGDGKILSISSGEEIIILDFYDKVILNTFMIEDIKKIIDNIFSDTQRESYRWFSGIERMSLNYTGSILYLITRNGFLISVDLKVKKITNTYLHLADFTGTSFLGAKGISKEMAEQLYKNGAIVDLD